MNVKKKPLRPALLIGFLALILGTALLFFAFLRDHSADYRHLIADESAAAEPYDRYMALSVGVTALENNAANPLLSAYRKQYPDFDAQATAFAASEESKDSLNALIRQADAERQQARQRLADYRQSIRYMRMGGVICWAVGIALFLLWLIWTLRRRRPKPARRRA
ncbi:MAG: hypothetical protein IJ662_03635 [Clostridia bacterium]|nr:hypothetical protein [Clostridia bacterium]